MADPARFDRAVMANFRALCFLTAERAALPHDKNPALAWTRSDPAPWPGFILSADFSNPDADIPEMFAKMKAGELPGRFLLTPDPRPADLERRLLDAGFELGVEWECMTCGADDFRPRVRPKNAGNRSSDTASVEITVATDDADVDHWARIVLSFLYARPGDPIAPLAAIGRGLAREAPVRLFVASYEGRPAASATLFMNDGVGGLYHVAVDPDFRRKGLGAAVTTAAVQMAFSQGCSGVILHASKIGAPLYAGLGFSSRFFVRGYRPGA